MLRTGRGDVRLDPDEADALARELMRAAAVLRQLAQAG